MTGTELDLLLSHACRDHGNKTELLIRKYNTVLAICEAPVTEICEVLGGDMRTAVYLKLALAISSRRDCNEADGIIIGNDDKTTVYLTSLFVNRSVETIFVLSLDESGRLIAADVAGEGTVNASTVIPRRILEIAKHRRASGIAIAHNHPGGEAIASKEDRDSYSRLCELLIEADLRLVGGYVVAGGKCIRL